MAVDPKPRRRRKLRIALLGGVVLILLLVIGWQNYWVRHKMLRGVTQVESVAYGFLSDPDGDSTETRLYLHRAQFGEAPPNSAIGLDALPTGIRVEIDVCFTSDHVPYLSHGDDHEGAAPQSLDFQQLTSKQVKRMKRKDGNDFLPLAEFTKRYLPRFDGVIIDVKTDHSDAQAKAEALAPLLDGHAGVCTITSLSGRFLWELRREVPDAKVGCESFGPLANWLADFDGYHAEIGRVDDARNEAADALGLRRLYYVADDKGDRKRIEAWKPEACIVKATDTFQDALR